MTQRRSGNPSLPHLVAGLVCVATGAEGAFSVRGLGEPWPGQWIGHRHREPSGSEVAGPDLPRRRLAWRSAALSISPSLACGRMVNGVWTNGGSGAPARWRIQVWWPCPAALTVA